MTDLKRLMLKVSAPAEYADDLSWDLAVAGAGAVEERDQGTMTPADDEDRVELIAGFENRAVREEAMRQLGEVYGGISFEKIDQLDDGWQHRWREFFKPVVLDTLQIVTPWMAAPAADRTPIVIDPGQAFGTGGHATTQLILRMLEARAARGTLPRRILDVGTGSGVLAIAARVLGAAEVLGIDIEGESIEAAEQNSADNGVGDGCTYRLTDAAGIDGTWPLVLANLQLDVFLTGAGAIAARVAGRGEILISGLLIEQVAACLSLFPGFELVDRLEETEWAALALRRDG